MKRNANKKRRRLSYIHLICWVIIPMAIIALLILDALKLYTFNVERLIIIGACIIVMLIPFLKEIRIKDFTIKK